jgi:hypothetical protein
MPPAATRSTRALKATVPSSNPPLSDTTDGDAFGWYDARLIGRSSGLKTVEAFGVAVIARSCCTTDARRSSWSDRASIPSTPSGIACAAGAAIAAAANPSARSLILGHFLLDFASMAGQYGHEARASFAFATPEVSNS